MENKQDNLDPVNMLLHAGVMMIFSGMLIAATVNIVYGIVLWIGAIVCFVVARKSAAASEENETEE